MSEVSAGTLVGAVLETAGYISQQEILTDLSSFFDSGGALLFIIAGIGGVLSVVIFGSYRMAQYILIAPAIFYFLIGWQTEVDGVMWRRTPQTEVNVARDARLLQSDPAIKTDNSGDVEKLKDEPIRIAAPFYMFASFTSSLVAEFSRVILAFADDENNVLTQEGPYLRHYMLNLLVKALPEESLVVRLLLEDVFQNCEEMLEASLGLADMGLSDQVRTVYNVQQGAFCEHLEELAEREGEDNPFEGTADEGRQGLSFERAVEQYGLDCAMAAQRVKAIDRARSEYQRIFNQSAEKHVELGSATKEFIVFYQSSERVDESPWTEKFEPFGFGREGFSVDSMSSFPSISCGDYWSIAKSAIIESAEILLTDVHQLIMSDGNDELAGDPAELEGLTPEQRELELCDLLGQQIGRIPLVDYNSQTQGNAVLFDSPTLRERPSSGCYAKATVRGVGASLAGVHVNEVTRYYPVPCPHGVAGGQIEISDWNTSPPIDGCYISRSTSDYVSQAAPNLGNSTVYATFECPWKSDVEKASERCDLVEVTAAFLLRNMISFFPRGKYISDAKNRMLFNKRFFGVQTTGGGSSEEDPSPDVTVDFAHLAPWNIGVRRDGDWGYRPMVRTENGEWKPFNVFASEGHMEAAFYYSRRYQTEGLQQGIFSWAFHLPYYQGVMLYLIAVAYPFFCFLVLFPGRAINILYVPLAWLWIKSWDIGFALVMVLERILWNLLPNAKTSFDVFADQELPSGNFTPDLPDVLTETFRIDPTYDIHAHFNYVSMALMAVPPLTGYAILKGKQSVLGSFVDGPKERALDSTGIKEGQFGLNVMADRIGQMKQVEGAVMVGHGGSQAFNAARQKEAAGWAAVRAVARGTQVFGSSAANTDLTRDGEDSSVDPDKSRGGEEKPREANASSLADKGIMTASRAAQAGVSGYWQIANARLSHDASHELAYGRFKEHRKRMGGIFAAMDAFGESEMTHFDTGKHVSRPAEQKLYRTRLDLLMDTLKDFAEGMAGTASKGSEHLLRDGLKEKVGQFTRSAGIGYTGYAVAENMVADTDYGVRSAYLTSWNWNEETLSYVRDRGQLTNTTTQTGVPVPDYDSVAFDRKLFGAGKSSEDK